MALTIMPSPVFEGFDDNGDPLPGGLLYTYAAGTVTPLATYTTSVGNVENTNPVVLDAAGRAVVYLSPTSYKFILKTSAGVTVWTQDVIQATPATNVDLDVVGTAGEALLAGEVVYLSAGDGGLTAGRWYKADADNNYSSTTANGLGMMAADLASGVVGSIRVIGRVTGLSALTAGTLYYVSATAGALTSSAPANARPVAVADSTTSVILSQWIPVPTASATLAGIVSTGTQTLAGAKTFSGAATFSVQASFNVQPQTYAGSSSTTRLTVGGAYTANATPVGNVGGGMDDLMSLALDANTLSTDGMYVKVTGQGTFAANANAKSLNIVYGGTTIALDTAIGHNGGGWYVEAHIVRTGAATQLMRATRFMQNAAGNTAINFYVASPAETLSGAVTVKFQAESGSSASNDVTQNLMAVQVL